MFDRPRDFLRALTDQAAPIPRSFDLHALLYRLCGAHAGQLDDCLGDRSWQSFAAGIHLRTQNFRTTFPRSWLVEVRNLLAEFAGEHQERLLVGCSAVLRSLDAYHRTQRTMLDRQIIALPARFGGRTAFLPPPENPIAELVPKARRLARGRSHQKHELRAILDLWWHLVALEHSPETPSLLELAATVSERLKSRLRRTGDLSVGLAAPFADLDFDFHSDPDGCHARKGIPYRFVGLNAAHLPQARGIVDRILEDCTIHHVDVLCFPELTLDNDLLGHLQRRLRAGDPSRQPALVVTGSFHLSGEMCWLNRCCVLDGLGDVLFIQDKCKGFEITRELAQEIGPDLCRKLGIDERGGFEDIRSSTEVVIADCALGRLVTPICLDFCGEELRELFIESRTNLFLVPAMTPRMRDFIERARELGTHCRGTTFVINSAWLLGQVGEPEDRDLFLGYVPAKGAVSGQPVRVSEALAVFSVRELLLDV